MKKNEYGFSAIELVIASTVLCIGIMPIVVSFLRINKNVNERGYEKISLLQAQGLLDEVKLVKWDETTTDPNILSARSAIGLDAGESLPSTNLDDIDDYNGYSDVPLPGYTRSVTVSYATVTVSGLVQSTTTLTDCKLIHVSVTKTAPPSLTRSVETLMVNGVEN